ncbi:MAG TPA: Cof-type HAD-IIB family hydrolase [Syntrophomonas sp.]|nr:Cof-type HAD-IIB family hydrolase [Syntrophomonas sp.]
MDIKLVALDLDDTLLDSGLEISPACVESIRRVRQQGVIITLATGRMFRSALPYARQLGIDVPLITYQGAWVKNSSSEEVLYYQPVPPLLARQVMLYFRSQEVHYHSYFNDELCMEAISPEGDDYARLAGVKPQLRPDLVADLDTYDAMKIMAVTRDESKLLLMEQELRENFGDQLYITRSKPYYLEVMSRQAGKALALELIARYFGINQSEVMAVGDSYNDLEMIKWAGMGVAMGNAVPAVKSAADFITFSNDAEGVNEALRRLVLKPCTAT